MSLTCLAVGLVHLVVILNSPLTRSNLEVEIDYNEKGEIEKPYHVGKWVGRVVESSWEI